MTDIELQGKGSVWLMHTMTDRAEEWAEEHIQEDAQMLGSAIAIEHRYVPDIAIAALQAGLSVSLNGVEIMERDLG